MIIKGSWMRARRSTTALFTTIIVFIKKKNYFHYLLRKKRKTRFLYSIWYVVRRLFLVSFYPEKKKELDKRDRSLLKLNMRSKRSAVIIISYIYKNGKRKWERKILKTLFSTLVYCLIINYTDGIYKRYCGIT